MSAPRGFPRTLRLASPMERERRRILSVELRDIAHEVEQLRVKTPPCERTSSSGDWAACDRPNSAGLCRRGVTTQSPAALPFSMEESAHTSHTCQPALMPSPLLPPKGVPPGWGLLPLFNSVRSKLESFAEIFLSPVKSIKDAKNSEANVQATEPKPPERLVLEELLRDTGGSVWPPAPSPGGVTVRPPAPSPGGVTVRPPAPSPGGVTVRPPAPSPGGVTVRPPAPSPGGVTVRPPAPSPGGVTVRPPAPSPGGVTVRPPAPSPGGVTVRPPAPSPGGVTVRPPAPSPGHLGEDPEECGLLSMLEDKSLPSQRISPNLRLQPETCHSPSVLCRPPLQRHLSCPLLPLPRQKHRHSLDTAETTAEPYTCRRRRRHSLGSLEEGHKLTPFSLSCLRKENHPSVLWQLLYQAGDGWKPAHSSVHSEGSPADLGLGKDREQGLSEEQVTEESMPDSDFKAPESHPPSKENKVSNIQIRKRVLKQEEKLTPMGLPKRVRLQKEDFSLEEIYTNKNYHTPTEKRKFETIFEEPKVKGGTLILTSQRPLRRSMVFKNERAAPRKRRKGRAAGRRCNTASTGEHVNYELLLQHKLNELETALQEDLPGP